MVIPIPKYYCILHCLHANRTYVKFDISWYVRVNQVTCCTQQQTQRLGQINFRELQIMLQATFKRFILIVLITNFVRVKVISVKFKFVFMTLEYSHLEIKTTNII